MKRSEKNHKYFVVFVLHKQQSSSLISRDDGCLFSLGKFQSPRLIAFLICLPESITPPLVNFPPLSTIFERNLAQIFRITLAEFHSDILKITHSAEHTPGGNISLILEIEIRCTADCALTQMSLDEKGPKMAHTSPKNSIFGPSTQPKHNCPLWAAYLQLAPMGCIFTIGTDRLHIYNWHR